MTNEQPEALRLARELDAYHTWAIHKEAAAELRRQHAEIERLQAENAELREVNDRFGKRQDWWTERMFSLEQDAERYRWLKVHKIAYNGVAHHWVPGEPLWDESLDAAIDALRGRVEKT